ncbi:hypothetical protein BgAZ_102090 [Babesia gibsoni]|uniref:Uncharacterized protein n=1 Tax=Babesia gibsoni TaxID=33632 RepID=A0AAD8PFB5_BABGI|nr:hypothetical protein BgAZ_102090 [Babesia gibsoni]
MINLLCKIPRQLRRANLLQPRFTNHLRHFSSPTTDKKGTHTQSGAFGDKPNIRDYYSRKEIAALFLQPFCVIVAYLWVLWQFFKYFCNVNSVEDFMKVLRWKYRNYILSNAQEREH